MVMGRRPGVATAPLPIAVNDLVGLAGSLGSALARVPFRRPLSGADSRAHNLAVAVTRETIRSFMGYASSLRIEEFRSVEIVLDDLCRLVMPPVVRAIGAASHPEDIAGVPGLWYRPRDQAPRGTILYLHGGGYIGTSPRMYAAFTSWLAHFTGCEIFVADYRLAPEFPFPAGLEDAELVLEALLHQGRDPRTCFVAGDSGGGGLASTLLYALGAVHHRPIGGVLLFSPEVDLGLEGASMTGNAGRDILPWNIPTAAYLHGRDPEAGVVSAVDQDVHGWPPTFVAYGEDEMFRDGIRRLVVHLDQGGVPTTSLEEAGMFHVFPILMPWAEASRRVLAAAGRFVDDQLAAAGQAPTSAPDAPPRAG
jgi:acetyl esterase/lipase